MLNLLRYIIGNSIGLRGKVLYLSFQASDDERERWERILDIMGDVHYVYGVDDIYI